LTIYYYIIIVGAGLYTLVWYLEPNVNWGSASEGYKYIQAHQAVINLGKTKDHVKNFRPSPLILIPFEMEEDDDDGIDGFAGDNGNNVDGAGSDSSINGKTIEMRNMKHKVQPQGDRTTSLMLLAKDLKKGHGLLLIGHVMVNDITDTSSRSRNNSTASYQTIQINFPNSPSHNDSKDEGNSASLKDDDEVKINTPLRGSNTKLSGDSTNVDNEVIKLERSSSFLHDHQRKPYENQYLLKSKCQKQIQKYMDVHSVTGFANVVCAPSYYVGATALMQVSGLGKLKTNTLVIPFPEDWYTRSNALNAGFVGLLGDAFDNGYGVCILRSNGKDYAAARDLSAPIDV
jgi:hypothetical protein